MKRLGSQQESVTLRRLFFFFIPLGLSALLINLSHVIVNGTLARADHPELILAGYATAMSLLSVTEKPAILFRETCSALVRDRLSFSAVRKVAFIVFGGSLAFGFMIAFTPVGYWVFGGAYGAEPEVAESAVNVYHALMFLSVFSGIRCLYQGVIIYKMRTRWLTIGMVIRLAAMFLMSQYMLHVGVTNSRQGAVIFVFGMIIEAAVSWFEGSKLARGLPKEEPDCDIRRPKQVLRFYSPLLFSSLIIMWVSPVMNALLGHTDQGTLAIASFSVAASFMNMFLGFFSYFHQISLQFYRTHPLLVRKFVLLMAFIPGTLISLMAFSPAGPWLLANVIGVEDRLLESCVNALRAFIPYAFVFPWLDTLNGVILSQGQTKLMFGSQTSNAVLTLILIVTLTLSLPGWTGALGALSQSGGILAELALLYFLFKRTNRQARLETGLRPPARGAGA